MKKNKLNEKRYESDFKIPQIPKVEGIRGVNVYQSEHFISPMFGRDVKDEITVPFTVRVIGDKIKKYDAFRTKPKMDDEKLIKETGSKYYEFSGSVISKDTRKKLFGIETYDTTKETKKIEEPVIKKEPSFDVKMEHHETFKKDDSQLPLWMRGRATSMQPDEEDVKIETHERPKSNIFVSASFMKDKDIEPSHVSSKSMLDIKPDSMKKQEVKVNKVSMANPYYKLPPVTLLKKTTRNQDEKPAWLLEQIHSINQTLQDHSVEGEVAGSKKGPTVTRHEISLEPGVPVKRVTSIQDNLMMNLAAKSLRIEAPIPGKPFVGIELPNKVTDIVSFGNVIDTTDFLDDLDHPLKVALGEDIDGKNIYIDIAKMPHGLIAGATNSGKSVCVNTILVSLLMKNKPEDLKLILIDPKMVELTPYNDLPHLITPVITDPKMASTALNWAVEEMENRYKKFSNSRSRDMKSYNENIKKGYVDDEKMPFIVIVIDELADLMMVSANDVEDSIKRITQKARAAGIHLLVATQRPTVDVIRGTIKSNIPTRIAFRVASYTDSTTILDGAGAEQLLGKGDMLLKEAESPIRLQGAYITTDEIDAVIDYIKDQQGPNYLINHDDLKTKIENKELINDDKFVEVAHYVVETQNCSINAILKEFGLGFNRAQKIVILLEQYGIVSSNQGTKSREVLIQTHELEKILAEAGLV